MTVAFCCQAMILAARRVPKEPADDISLTIYILFAVVMLTATLLLFRFLLKFEDWPCEICGHKRKFFKSLPPSTQDAIRSYFTSCEHRDPRTRDILVCDGCHTVFDDFSGDRKGSMVEMPGVRALITHRTWCKVCNVMITFADPTNDDIRCETCGTPYAWKTHEESGYRFLMPPPGANVLHRCDDTGDA